MSDKSNPYKVPTTGHVWDDNLAELLNEPPKWWMIGFWASIAMVVIYFLVYPSIPLVNSHFKGITGWTSIKEYKEDLQAIEQVRAKYENRLQGMSAAAILADDELTEYVVRSAKVLFGDKCAACHGTGGAGNPNFPVLVDDDWLYGGKIEDIVQSITNGRRGYMPAHEGKLSDQEIADLAKHVKALSEGGEYAPGKEIFMGKGGCFGCHGPDAKGNTALGAANLTLSECGYSSRSTVRTPKIRLGVSNQIFSGNRWQKGGDILPFCFSTWLSLLFSTLSLWLSFCFLYVRDAGNPKLVQEQEGSCFPVIKQSVA